MKSATVRLSLKSLLVIIALAFDRVTAVAAETPEQIATGLAQQALTNSGAMQILTELTEIGPRLAGSEAEKRAARWAKQRFEQLGFDEVRVENFSIEHGWARGIEKAEVTSPLPQPLGVTALGGGVGTPPEGLEAEIALFKTYDEFLAAPTGSLTGKIVVVTQPMARTQDGSGYGFAYKIRGEGPSEAARRGAVAYLLRSLATDHHRLPHTGETDYAKEAPRIPCAALSVPDAEQLDRLAARGEPVRIKLELTPRDLGPVASQNVIAEIKGREKPDEIILLGAHLDSWDLGTGAIDDGAGDAIVMAAGRLIGTLPQRPKRTIRVVLFGAEECGLFGGEAYVKAHKIELNHHIIATEADFGQGPVYAFQTGVANPDEPSLRRILKTLTSLAIIPGDNQTKGDSETELLFGAGVPVAALKLDGTDYFDFHHTADDTLDKVKPERINQSTAAFAVFAYLAAELGGDYRLKTPTATK